MEKSTSATCVAILFCALILNAQAKPNFSGKWVSIGPADAPIGLQQTITQDATTLTVGHASEGGGHKVVYRLDGSENSFTTADVHSVARAWWNKDKLEIHRVDNYPDGRVRQNQQVWSLQPNGNLVIESTDGLVGETPTERRTIYKKGQ
jgi:hypothetical protein